jgi:hypothetical protein
LYSVSPNAFETLKDARVKDEKIMIQYYNAFFKKTLLPVASTHRGEINDFNTPYCIHPYYSRRTAKIFTYNTAR